MRYIILVLTMALGLSGYLYIQEVKSHEKTKIALESSTVVIESLKDSINKNSKDQLIIESKNRLVNLELAEVKRKLSDLKGRESAYIAKPELVSKLINKDFSKDEAEFACLTGDTKLCQ